MNSCIFSLQSQVVVISLLLFLNVLEDILYGSISLDVDIQETLPLSKISTTLRGGLILSYDPLKVRAQLILCYLVSEDDELCAELCFSQELILEFIEECSSTRDFADSIVVLRKFRAIAKVSNNRILFRQLGLLKVLETLLEQFADSEIEALAAELIFVLLSDPNQVDEKKPCYEGLLDYIMISWFI